MVLSMNLGHLYLNELYVLCKAVTKTLKVVYTHVNSFLIEVERMTNLFHLLTNF